MSCLALDETQCNIHGFPSVPVQEYAPTCKPFDDQANSSCIGTNLATCGAEGKPSSKTLNANICHPISYEIKYEHRLYTTPARYEVVYVHDRTGDCAVGVDTQMSMSQRRVCDACSIRRVKCDGQTPCAACITVSLDCTRLRPRHKAGPKGIRKKTIEKVAAARQRHTHVPQTGLHHAELTSSGSPNGKLRQARNDGPHPGADDATLNVLLHATNCDCSARVPSATTHDGTVQYSGSSTSHGRARKEADLDSSLINEHNQQRFSFTVDASEPQVYEAPFGNCYRNEYAATQQPNVVYGPETPPKTAYPYRVPAMTLEPYLEIYHHKLYPVWPIVEKAPLAARLQVPQFDADAYMLALSVCVATMLQLQLQVIGADSSLLEPKSMISEVENQRQLCGYRETPSLDALSTSFFLHVAFLHIGRRPTSTLLLREAISLAHMLGLHEAAHYEGLPRWEVQDHLRKLWLLFITER